MKLFIGSIVCCILSFAISVNAQSEWKEIPTPEDNYFNAFSSNPSFYADGFDFPVGSPDAKQYYKARNFLEDFHLGEDWNALTGGNSDLGDPVYSVANGYVTYAEDVDNGARGWGKVVRVVHCINKGGKPKLVESLYAHLDEMYCQKGDFIKRGQKVGTIGTANGKYTAHLHFEMRTDVLMLLGAAYGDHSDGYIYPTEFINKNRPSDW